VIPGLYLVDTSAVAVARGNKEVAARIDDLGQAGLLATCLPLDLEAGYSATSPIDHALIMSQRRQLLIELANTPEVARTALEIQSGLARQSRHRAAASFDVMTAAFGVVYGAVILHNDREFDAIAEVTGQNVERIG
jgi:predicted nucleic acid-binding protein